ncbi:DNA-binding protein [Clostridium botulinum]|uniref:DNA-binding protein n=1 Tax=Clostridium TaxID=1485 RepID=UPI0022384878|nr:DNA-binding protein [Clostridium sporogenes]EKO1912693.1 DNA-binding protein [Clostridium botulinum]EKO2042754.1 DNA-binding protein [Clostridium botulinum]MCW6073984.1 DNA-binding protein [Clostridium sporogenes]
MLDKEEVKASEEVVENIEKEEEKVKEVNDEKVSEDETDKINEFVEEEALKNKEEEIDKSAKEDKEEKTKEEEVHNDIKDKVGFLQYFKEGIKNTLGIFVVSIGGLAIIGLILRYIIGLYVKDAWGMLFIVYLVVSLFYPYIKAKFYRKNK